MCGDGANDAPALRQAQMGIAVSTATDVAKAAAGIVLTGPGLDGIVTCIKEGRSAFQRVLTYTLSILVNKSVGARGIGRRAGHDRACGADAAVAGNCDARRRFRDDVPRCRPGAAVTVPERVARPQSDARCDPVGPVQAVYYVAVLAAWLVRVAPRPGADADLYVGLLVFAGQATVYVLREQGHFWNSRPAAIMLFASAFGLMIVAFLAIAGVLMTPIVPVIVGILLMATFVHGLALDLVKVAVFARLRID